MTAPEYPDLIQYATPFFVLLMALELLVLRKQRHPEPYPKKDTLTSLTMGSGYVLLALVFGGFYYAMYHLAYSVRIHSFGFEWWVIACCFVIDDFRYYWFHRFSHELRWMWASHVNHHSSEHYNLSTALRQPWGFVLTGDVLLQLPLAFVGIHPNVIVLVGSANLLYQFWIHTESIDKMPRWFEWLLNTPSHHRVHHGRNPRYLDANYAGTLMIWDRMFGTFVPEQSDEQVQYGLVKNLDTYNPVKVAFHELFAIIRDVLQPGLTLRARFNYVFGPPGYSHDSSRKTATQLKEERVTARPELAGKPGLPRLES